MVELPVVPLVRAGVGVPVLRRDARDASGGRPARVPPLRASRGRAVALRCLRLGLDRASPGPGHRAPGVRARGQRLPPGRRGGRPRPRARGLRGGAARRARRHADGGQGPRLPRRRPRCRGRRRLDPALPGLPRRGAHLRPRHAARRARGPGRRPRARARPDPGARRAHDPLRGRPRRRRVPGRGARRRRALRYPPFSTLIRVVCSSEVPGAALAAATAVSRACPARWAGAALPPARPRARPGRGQGAGPRGSGRAGRRGGAGGGRGPRRSRRRLQRGRRPAVATLQWRWQSRMSRTSRSPRHQRHTAAAPRSGGRRAARCRARARAGVRRSGAEGAGPPGGRLRRSAARGDRADERASERRARDRAGATWVGVLNRVLVYRVEHDSPVNALVNPVLESYSGEKETMEEGCLSLPGVHVDVERPTHVRVRAQDATGESILIEATGLEARVIQHEMDHLDGVLILRLARCARPGQGGHADPPQAPEAA